MIKILFVCHGNICRSPMAEFVFKDLVKKQGISSQFLIDSAATSTEEIGNGIHPGTVSKLREQGIFVNKTDHRARQITKSDYENYDFLIGMDSENLWYMNQKWNDGEKKIFLLLDFANVHKNIADPWFTRNFDETYEDILKGCKALLKKCLEIQKN